MSSISNLGSRDTSDLYDDDDSSYGNPMGHLVLVFFTLLLVGSLCALALFYLRRKRMAQKMALLPTHHHHSLHHRSVSVTNFPIQGRNDAIFVYDEKMNLIANSSGPMSQDVPEIRITFPDEDDKAGEKQQGRVVVVHITDTGSVGMAPLEQESLPAYQRHDNDRFQSLDLDRMGGLKEKETSGPRWS